MCSIDGALGVTGKQPEQAAKKNAEADKAEEEEEDGAVANDNEATHALKDEAGEGYEHSRNGKD